MRNRTSTLLLLLLLTLALPGCNLVGGLIKAGFWTGIIVVVVIVALIAFLFRGRRGGV